MRDPFLCNLNSTATFEPFRMYLFLHAS